MANLKDDTNCWFVYITRTKEFIHIEGDAPEAQYAAEWAAWWFGPPVYVLGQKFIFKKGE